MKKIQVKELDLPVTSAKKAPMPLSPLARLKRSMTAKSAFSPRGNSPRNSPRFRAQSQRFKQGQGAAAGAAAAAATDGGVTVISPMLGAAPESKTAVKKATPGAAAAPAAGDADVPH